ncbi:F-box domain [Dillenia turbinata]|uniref:F-box protein GID2 n=1 Tax=Dillenia turbinata TaxID=194707 RepID=A0AAN8VZF9_9MAGN
MMKRELESNGVVLELGEMKKRKQVVEKEEETGFMLLDENLLFEVLKHVDARTLATAACVSKQWHKTADDERLWELICTKHSANIGCATTQLRSVVLALGGFRHLYSLYLLPLSKPSSSSSNSSSPSTSTTSSSWCGALPSALASTSNPSVQSKPPTKWGKDEVHLSLSLFSIRYYEKMNIGNRGR